LSAKIRQLLQKRTGDSIPARRDRVLALIATADDSKHSEESPLTEIVQKGWRAGFAPALADGRNAPALSDVYALLEMLHAIRDNLKIDLRDDALDYFAHLPTFLIAGNYPAPYRAPENEFRIPVYQGDGQPDLNRAALARAAGLSMVAFDNKARPTSFCGPIPISLASAIISFRSCSMTLTLGHFSFDPPGMKTPIGSAYTRAKRSCFATAMSRW
jgi:hypothetical protein